MMQWRKDLGLDTILDTPDPRQLNLKKVGAPDARLSGLMTGRQPSRRDYGYKAKIIMHNGNFLIMVADAPSLLHGAHQMWRLGKLQPVQESSPAILPPSLV
jgi:hypothetical protein